MNPRKPLLASLAFLSLLPGASAGAIPAPAVRLEQITYPTLPFSVVGEITVDRALAGAPGFINVIDPATNGWLVRNLPLLTAADGYTHATISTKLDLTAFVPGGVGGVQVAGPIQLVIDLDPLPAATASEVLAHGTLPTYWSVFALEVQYGGEDGVEGDMTPGMAPDFTGLWFNPIAMTMEDVNILAGHENVQAAHNQCAPAAISNCLQYLENRHGLTVPHPNNPGLRTLGGAPPDGTLVGAIDDTCQRNVVANRRDVRSWGVWPLEGALRYLSNQNLGPFVRVEHRFGQVAGNSGNVLDPNADFAFAGLTSYGDVTANGTTLNVASLSASTLAHGVAVAFDFRRAVDGSRHYVTLVGAGRVLGKPFFLHVSDARQASKDATDTLGCDRVDFDWIEEDARKLLNENAILDQMLSFAYDAPGWEYCFGSGLGTACPCANHTQVWEHAGCRNALGTGGTLRTRGVSSLAADSLRLDGAGMPNSSVLYFQGTAQMALGAGVVFGDGLRCAGGAIIRLGVMINAGGASTFPGAGDPPVSVKGAVPVPGLRYYQCWYRDAAAFCTPATFNLTNGIGLSWSP